MLCLKLQGKQTVYILPSNTTLVYWLLVYLLWWLHVSVILNHLQANL